MTFVRCDECDSLLMRDSGRCPNPGCPVDRDEDGDQDQKPEVDNNHA